MQGRRLTDKIANKMRDSAGESIAETLVALLISALALVMLAGAISAASRVVERSRTKLDDYYDANEQVVMMESGGNSATVTISSGEGATSETLGSEKIIYYRNDVFEDNPVIAYKIDR